MNIEKNIICKITFLFLCYPCYETCSCIFGKTVVTDEHIDNFQKSKVQSSLSRLINCFGTSGYIISSKGAAIMKKGCFPLDNEVINVPFLNNINCFSIDSKMNAMYKKSKSYVVTNPCVITPHISEKYESTIK